VSVAVAVADAIADADAEAGDSAADIAVDIAAATATAAVDAVADVVVVVVVVVAVVVNVVVVSPPPLKITVFLLNTATTVARGVTTQQISIRKQATITGIGTKQHGTDKQVARKVPRNKYVLAQRAKSAKLRTQFPKMAKMRTQKRIT
jgi:hypothetical protein